MGFPKIDCHSAKPDLFLNTLKSWELLLLTEKEVSALPGEEPGSTRVNKSCGEYCCSLKRRTPPWALGAGSSSDIDLSWASAVHLPKGFLNHLIPEKNGSV